MKFTKLQLLFFIIFVEGYVVLACELLAIRELIPFVGSGTDVISIIISAILLPLAVGYYHGGQAFAHHRRRRGKTVSVRHILLRNIFTALAILGIGLSYTFMEIFFYGFTWVGVTERLPQAALYCLLFIVWPVYLLGQTVPLVSNYFSHERLSAITGRMLFFSTTGSFVGSVLSTLVLMMWIGVHNTVIVTMMFLFLLICLLSRRLFTYELLAGTTVLGLVIIVNNNYLMGGLGVVSNNVYNLTQISRDEDTISLTMNRAVMTMISLDHTKTFGYVKYAEDNFIKPLANASPPRDILVIGAGGFAMGLNDTSNHYTFIDIDKDIKEVAEKYFLMEKLSPNKKFVPVSARAFVHSDRNMYDLIIIDTYTNSHTIPMETVTQEFLQEVKNRLKPDGIVFANVASSPNMSDKFSVRYTNTFFSVFPHATRHIYTDFNAWAGTGGSKPPPLTNALYVFYNNKSANDLTVYTDDKNTWSLDTAK